MDREDRFEIVDKQVARFQQKALSGVSLHIIRDTRTGVLYLFQPDFGSMTVMLDRDGKPLLG